MEQSVYADVLFLINFSMDFLSLYICARVLHKRIWTLQMTVSASLGGIYSVARIFFDPSLILQLVFDVAVAMLMCFIAYGRGRRIRSLFGDTLVFFVCEMLFGGIFTASYNLFGKDVAYSVKSISDIGLVENDMPIWLFAVLAVASALVTYLAGLLFKSSGAKKSVRIRISLDENKTYILALVDSGNLLRDPISGRAVIIVGYDTLKTFLPRSLKNALVCDKIGGDLGEKTYGMRFIPYESVGKSDVFIGFIPDGLGVYRKDGWEEIDAVIAIDKNRERFGECEALIPSVLIKG